MKYTNETILAILHRQFPDAILAHSEPYGLLTLETSREHIWDMIRFLKENAETDMNFLTSLCGMHYPQNEGKELGVVYHLHSFRHNLRCRVKAFFPISDPHIPTLTNLWPTANWMERQEYDFFGIIFDGHPDLRRILNVDEMEVFPMRKEYRLEDGTRTDKDDRFFGRQGHEGREFDT